MTYTNKLNLPQAFVDAVTEQEKEHQKADYSVTQLLKGSTEIALTMLHDNELVSDVSDNINVLFGSAVHSILEKHGGQDAEVYMECDLNGHVISGKADLIESDLITDWKTCSSWKITFKDFTDWRKQLIAYSYLHWRNTNETITNGRIVALIKDWSPTSAERDRDYPQSPVAVLNFEWDWSEATELAVEFILKINKVEESIKTNNFPPCSEEDRWHEADKWALMKEGRQSALKLYDNEADAKEACNKPGLSVEHRRGKDKKCDKYCDVGRCGFCPYYNSTHKEVKDEV